MVDVEKGGDEEDEGDECGAVGDDCRPNGILGDDQKQNDREDEKDDQE